MLALTCKVFLVLLHLHLASSTFITMDWCVNHIMSLIEDNKKCLHFYDTIENEVVMIRNITCSILTTTKVEVQNYEDLSSIVLSDIPFTRFTFWKGTFDRLIGRRAVVVVLFKEDVNLSKVFEEFWHYRIADLVLIDRTLRVYTYRPVSQGDPSTPVFLGGCRNVSKYTRESDTRYFGNCTLAVYTNQNRPFTDFGNGLEDKMLAIMAEHLKFDVNVQCEACRWGNVANFLLPFDYDLGMAGLLLDEEGYLRAYQLYYQIQNELAYFTPFAKAVQPWRNALDIFDMATWTCTIGAIAALVFVGYLAHIEDTLFQWVSMLFLNACHGPSRLKLLHLLWNLFALIMTSVYSGLLVSFMCKTRLEGQPSTLDELVELGYQLGAGLIDMDPRIKHLSDTVNCTQEATECYDRLVQGGFAYFCSTHKMMFRLSTNKMHKWYKLPSERSLYMALVMMYRSPFLQRVQQYLLYFAENGILIKLDEYGWKLPKKENESGFTIVTLDHLGFVFVVHLAGILCAAVAFVAELVCWWYFKTQLKELKHQFVM